MPAHHLRFSLRQPKDELSIGNRSDSSSGRFVFEVLRRNFSNFPEPKLSEADRCSMLLQNLGAEVRQYVVLHCSSSDWEALRKTLRAALGTLTP